MNVDDIKGLFARVKEKGGDVPFGPSWEENEKFWFGGFADIEGNLFWVVEKPCDPKPVGTSASGAQARPRNKQGVRAIANRRITPEASPLPAIASSKKSRLERMLDRRFLV